MSYNDVLLVKMASGIEVAGLVLSAFPLVVKGLTAYVDGVRAMNYWKRYTWELRGYARRLRTQRIWYIKTLELLFDGVVKSEKEIAALIEDPVGPLWREEKYTENLIARLDHCYDHFLETLGSMMASLEKLADRLGIDADGNVHIMRVLKRRESLLMFGF